MSTLLPSDADASSRLQSGILTPSSDGSLQQPNASAGSAGSEGRKRKRSASVAMNHLLQSPIDLKSHPPNLHIPPRTLHPLMLIARHYLPLGAFDLLAPHGDLPQSRFFESRIKVLDLESRMGTRPSILLARSEPKGTVFALERQEPGLYAVCKIGSWVNLDRLAEDATAVVAERIREPKEEPKDDKTKDIATLTTPQTYKEEKKKRFAIEAIQSLVRKRSHSQSLSISEAPTIKPEVTITTQMPSSELATPDASILAKSEPEAPKTPAPPMTAHVGDTGEQQTAQAIFDNIRTHYAEALYKSKGSLAYFAKGPLSRARSAFRMDLESNLDMEELLTFLRSMVLTTVQIDKKFRETIPELLSQMNTGVDSSDEGQKKRRRPKKMKLGRNGLYPLEDECIREWWATNKPDVEEDAPGATLGQIKFHSSLLRTRETQLQMILIMETLALESVKETTQPSDSNLPALPGALGANADPATPPMAPPKKRNKHNLSVLIDVHADRLNIWQSTASEEQLSFEDTQISTQPQQTQQDKSSSEPLKDFCVDVIMPFYMARLPQLCEPLNRKLGGPVLVSQSKHKSLKRSSSKQEQKPGSAAKRTARHKEPRTLERALSYDQQRRSMSRGPSNALALMRTATSAATPSLKREESEPGTTASVPKRQSSLVRSSSMADLRDIKANKKAKVDAELRDAISAIRKPNREVVSKAMQEEADRKTSSLSTGKGKIRKPYHSSFGTPNIQVEATPANTRFRDVLGVKPDAATNIPIPSTEIIPPSSIGAGPSTGERTVLRHTSGNGFFLSTDSVGCTPTKPSGRHRNANEDLGIPPSSPLFERNMALPASPDVRDDVQPMRKLSFQISHDDVLFATPTKRPTVKPMSRPDESVTTPLVERNEMSKSIYQKLGWDDELDDF